MEQTSAIRRSYRLKQHKNSMSQLQLPKDHFFFKIIFSILNVQNNAIKKDKHTKMLWVLAGESKLHFRTKSKW